MRYAAYVTKEGRQKLAEFPDCPGCQTFADPDEDIEERATEALTGWMESMFAAGDAIRPPRDRARAPKGGRIVWIEVPARMAVQLSLRWARQSAGLSQAQLAKRAGVSQQQIAKIEHLNANPTIDTLERVSEALGLQLHVSFEST